jgi:ferredoxin
MNILVDQNRCPQNHPCPSIRVCPTGAIVQAGLTLRPLIKKNALAVRNV